MWTPSWSFLIHTYTHGRVIIYLAPHSQSAFLEVVIPPDIISEETTNDLMVPEGGAAKLVCKARGYPKPDIMWRREDGTEIIARTGLPGGKTKRKDSKFYFVGELTSRLWGAIPLQRWRFLGEAEAAGAIKIDPIGVMREPHNRTGRRSHVRNRCFSNFLSTTLSYILARAPESFPHRKFLGIQLRSGPILQTNDSVHTEISQKSPNIYEKRDLSA